MATVCGFGFVAVRGELGRPSLSDWRLVAVSGVLQMATYSALTAVALTRLPPGRASVPAFSTPLWVAPLSAWWVDERLTWRALAGVGTGLTGVLVIVSPTFRQGERSQLAFYALLLCAAAAWAVSIVFVRAHRLQSSALALAPWQMLVAVLLLLPLAVILEGAWPTFLGLLLSTVAFHESLYLSLKLGILLIGGGIWIVTNLAVTPPRRPA